MANKIRIITVGKAHDAKLREAIADYEQRLAPTKVVWHVLPPKTEASVAETIASESYAIASTLKEAEYIVVLDERGETLTSEAFSAKIISALATHKDFSFVIGGAYGVNDAVRKRANLVVSLNDQGHATIASALPRMSRPVAISSDGPMDVSTCTISADDPALRPGSGRLPAREALWRSVQPAEGQ